MTTPELEWTGVSALSGLRLMQAQVADESHDAQLAAHDAYLAAQADCLRPELANLHATQTSRGLVVNLGDVLFATGHDTLNPGAARDLDQITAFQHGRIAVR